MAPCRIAVVGAGPLVGAQHCDAVKSLEGGGAELACLCQRRPEDTAKARELGVPVYTDVFEMARAEALDGVVVAAPTHLHLSVVEACIEGARARQRDLGQQHLGLRAVLVEKPICEDLRSAMELVELTERAGVVVLVGHQRRHSPFVQRARELVQSADFGPLRGLTAEFSLLKPEPYFEKDDPKLAWRRQKGKGGPLLINIIHDVDLMRYITGHEVTKVFAATSSAARANQVEDTGGITVVLDHGAVGTLFFSDAAPSPWSYEFTTRENKKYPPVPGSEQKDCYHFLGAQRSMGFPSLRRFSYGPEAKVPGWDAPLSLEEDAVERADPIKVQMAHFARVCRGEARPVCSGRDALQSLAVIMASLRSAETQEAVCPGDMLKEAAGLSRVPLAEPAGLPPSSSAEGSSDPPSGTEDEGNGTKAHKVAADDLPTCTTTICSEKEKLAGDGLSSSA